MTKLDLKAARKALLKTFQGISQGARSIKSGENIEKKINEALEEFSEIYESERRVPVEEIDLDKVKITKENE